MRRILAIDLGTSSVRAALFNKRAVRIDGSLSQRSYPLATDASGMAILDAKRVLTDLRACIGDALQHGAVDAVGVSSFWHGLIGIDARGKPTTPMITWADSRCREDAAQLRAAHSEAAHHARTGTMLRASFWPAKLRWLKRTQPSIWKRTVRWMSPIDWCMAMILRVDPLALPTAHGMATATGLYDPERCAWDVGACRLAGVRVSQLPTISDEHYDTQRCEFPALRAAHWAPAIGDGAASNLGAGCTAPGTAAVSFGTSGAIRIVRSRGRASAPLGLFCYRIDARRFLIGGAISNAGALRAWCLETLRLPDEAALERTLRQRPLPVPALRVLPFWIAERAPSWREDLSGAITGITQATSAIDCYQAITDATYQRLATIFERIPGPKPRRIVIGGGLQRSAQAVARLAAIIGQPLICSDEAEASLRGAAVLVAERLGCTPAMLSGTRIVPQAKHVRAFRAARAQLAALEATLHP